MNSDISSIIADLELFPPEQKQESQDPFVASHDVLKEKNQIAEQGGGDLAIRRYHQKHKMTARERIEYCLDADTFHEIDKFVGKTTLGDGIVGGWGLIQGRKTFIFAWDFTVIAGTCGYDNAGKVVKLQDMALKEKCPIIGINDSGGARIQEGMLSLAAYSRIFYGNSAKLSGRIPQISLIMGNCAGGAVYSPAMTDLIIMTDYSFMAITGPIVLKAATGVDVKASDLGGARIQEQESGVVHLTAPDDRKALDMAKEFFSFLPSNFREKPAVLDSKSDPANRLTTFSYDLLQGAGENAFDIRVLIKDVVDNSHYFELQKNYAPNVSIGFARISGIPIGIIANNSRYQAGCLDINSSCKAARFVNLCNLFNIPIINFVDVPGFLASLEQERGGIIRHGAKLLFSQCVADVPKISIIVRKSFGGAYCVMLSKDIQADRVFAVPSSVSAVMGASGAVDVIYRKELQKCANPEARAIKRQKLIDQYNKEHLNPWGAAGFGKIDEVIPADQIRIALTQELPHLFSSYQPPKDDRKFPNIPL